MSRAYAIRHLIVCDVDEDPVADGTWYTGDESTLLRMWGPPDEAVRYASLAVASVTCSQLLSEYTHAAGWSAEVAAAPDRDLDAPIGNDLRETRPPAPPELLLELVDESGTVVATGTTDEFRADNDADNPQLHEAVGRLERDETQAEALDDGQSIVTLRRQRRGSQ